MAKKDIGTGLKDDLFTMVRGSDGVTSAELLERVSASKSTVRKRLVELESEGLIRCETQSGIRARLWTATDKKVKSKPLPGIGTRFIGGKNPWNA